MAIEWFWFEEFRKELEASARGLEDAYLRAWELLPPDPALAVSQGLGWAYFHLMTATCWYKEVIEQLKELTPADGAGLTWAEIYPLIEAAYNLRYALWASTVNDIEHDLKLEELEAKIGEIAKIEAPDISEELAALSERVEGIGRILAKWIMKVGTLQEAAIEAEYASTNPWRWLKGFATGLIDVFSDLLALPAEVVIDTGEKILDHIWGEEYTHWGEPGWAPPAEQV